MPRSESLRHSTPSVGISLFCFPPSPFVHRDDLNFDIAFELRNVTINELSLDLEYSSFINPMDAEEMDEELLESISNTEPSLTGLRDQYLNAKSENPMFNTEQPWILDFASSLLDCCRYGESDCLYHPIGVILVVSSTDSDPIRRFDELSQRILQKKEFRQRMYSKSIPFYYLLLHSGDSQINPEVIFHNMKASFDPQRCFIVSINSLPPSEARSSTPAPYDHYFQSGCTLP